MSLRLSDFIKQFNLKIEIGEFPGGPVVRTAVSLLKARVWSLVGELGSYKSCGEVKKNKRLTKHYQLFVVTLVLIKFFVICFNFPFSKDVFIYFWLCWVFFAACGLFAHCSEQGATLVAGLRRLIAVASLVAEHWPSSTRASVVAAHRF